MATELATAYISLVPSLRGAASSITKDFRGIGTGGGTEAGHGFRSTFSQIVGGTFVGQILGDVFRAATRGVVDAVRSAFEATARWGTITAQTGAVIKSTGAGAGVTATQIHGLAMSIERTTGTQAESVQQGENLLLTFRSLKNGVGAGNDVFNQATVALVDMSRALGKDPQDAAIQLGKALNDPITGMTALRRVGVSFTQDQQKLIKSLAESGNVMGAQKVILAELTAEFGGSGAAFAQTFTGKLTLMREAWGHITEELFKGVQPGLGAVFSSLTNIMNRVLDSGALDTFSAKLSKLGEGAAKKIGDIATKIGDLYTAAKSGGLESFVSSLSNISPVLSIAVMLFQTMSPLMPAIKDALSKLAKPLTDLFTALVPVIPPLTSLALKILPPLVDLLIALAPALAGAVQALTPVAEAVGKGLSKWGDLDKLIKGLSTGTLPGLDKALDGTDSSFHKGVDAVVGFGVATGNAAKEFGRNFNNASVTVSSTMGSMASTVGSATTRVASFFGINMDNVKRAVGIAASSVGTSMGTIGRVTTVAINTVSGDVNRGAAAFGAFASNLGGAIGRAAGAVGNAMGQIGAYIGRAATAFGSAVGVIVGSMGRIVGAIASGVGDAVGVIAGLPGKAVAALGDLGGRLVSAGAALVGGFAKGISGAVGKVTGAVGDVLGAIGNLLPHSPAKEGPLSGSGWTRVKESGAALFEQFVSGMNPDLTDVLAVQFGAVSGSLLPALSVGSSGLLPPAQASAPVFPSTVVLKDADGSFLARMRVEAQGVVDTQATWADIQARGGVVR